jgi:NADH:ubiquinone oxidoreductase subunit K
MIVWLAGLIGVLGLASILSRKTLLGTLVGIQTLILGCSMTFVLAGISGGERVQGTLFATFILLSGVAQLVAGYALVIRFFYLKKGTEMRELRSLKQ